MRAYQLSPAGSATRAEDETIVGGQILFRNGEAFDLGLEVLQTFETRAVSRATTARVYIAWSS
ncbi:MAG: hypothetical protein AAGF12_09765 [Myxococcota bacterium]